jgi:hypothetical protein
MLAQRQESTLPLGLNKVIIYGLAYLSLMFIFNLFLIKLALDSVLYSGSELIVG